MRTINEIIIHCSATIAGRHVTVQEITAWHRARGFRNIGYHYVVDLDGTVYVGRPVKQAGAHCHGHNAHSIGVCYIGGLNSSGHPCDTRTPAQKRALSTLISFLKAFFPAASVHGHNEFAHKACPCFDVSSEYS